jgi:hypothetical protein
MNRNKKGKFTRVPSEVPVEKLTPLDITCGSTKCESRLHCFSLKKSSIRKFGKEGVCRECGTDLIDWSRIHKRDIKDAEFIFNSMKNELIRHVFWHTEVDNEAIVAAKKEGKENLKLRARKVLKARVLKHNSFMDGRQTPMGNGDIINYAQHATATCCRKCIEVWHNIPQEEILSEENLDFFIELILLYAQERVPHLNKK